jgi:5'(3')-deoxyribonucleotidase
MKTILCDLDGVVADFWGPVLETVKREEGVTLTDSELDDWDMVTMPGGTSTWDRPGFFSSLRLLPGAYEGLLGLTAKHDVYLVSAGNGAALAEKSKWVRTLLPFMRDRVFFVDGKTPKGLLRGDVLIDDAPHNLMDFKKRNPAGLAIAAYYPYTAPAVRVSDYVVPFHGGRSAQAWKSIVGALR